MDFTKMIKCGEGSSRIVYNINNNILKIPKYINYNNNKEYYIYLLGVNQILTEIDIYNKAKKHFYNNLLCPIKKYGIDNNILYAIYEKIIPAPDLLKKKDFDLEFFCRKLNLNATYNYLFKRIMKLSFQFHLDAYDLLENEDNFGYRQKDKKILLIDYGYKDNFKYNINNLLDNNIQLSKKILGDTTWLMK